ncbi:unnamed protein product [Mytilus coruscus]|uniref:Protein kinase domain-containing protein n=1 Tax=Mytilus coruscus TaxID=42192 RepID=A0A6J8C8H5_MYTCO|nr:unnamed protein product [Mytilus coruscus]
MESFDKLKIFLMSLTEEKCSKDEIDSALRLLDSIHDYTKTLAEGILRYINVNDIDPIWHKIGYGHFGNVYASKYRDSKVAIKILKEESNSKIKEGVILHSLSHENVIAFRGIGYISRTKAEELKIQVSKESKEMMFLVMEYIDQNLLTYVDGMKVHERKGLRYYIVWNIGQQIISALNYLHNLDIAHRDLKPDNILLEVGPRKIVVKLADFGLSTAGNQIKTSAPPVIRMLSGLGESRANSNVANIRWCAPEVFQERLGHEWSLEDNKKADIYSFGSVLTFMLTGERPYDKISTDTLADSLNPTENIQFPDLPKTLTGHLKDVIVKCHHENPSDRPTAKIILKDFFSSKNNPYLNSGNEAEFFSCGFMEKTPTGYAHWDLNCSIDVENVPYRDIPDEWSRDEEEHYRQMLFKFKTMAKDKVIDNNPTVALKGLTFARTGEEENQIIEFRFKESDYVHHRAMRKIWIDFSDQQKIEELPSKADRGLAAPGIFTCGAVESASKPDYKIHNGNTCVDLVNTAARGLKEELGLELSGSDLDAICLTTVYLKFDTHEWGLCGFVDLKDERIDPKHRISANSLKDIFSTGPKDKFEHQTLTFIDFNLKTMVEFVFNNHEQFASSAKLVVVKVLQAFYGWQRVQQEFEIMRHGK